MELDFEIAKEVGMGDSPDVLHFTNMQAQLLYLKSGKLFGMPTNRIYNGRWENAAFEVGVDVSPDSGLSDFQVNSLSGFGAVGSYRTVDAQKMIIYEYAFEMDRFLANGSIKHSLNTPIASFTLDLENPLNENPEYEGNVFISEETSFLSPGSKVVFEFSMGDSETFPMGVFYVDRSNFTLLNETVSLDGRNIVGKALYDQTFDEDNVFGYNAIHEILKGILLNANINPDEILIENTSIHAGYQFDYNMTYLEGIMEILKALDNWKIAELVDGTVVIGSGNYAGFERNSSYVFYRDKDIFTRNIVRDDQEAYRRVCVHNRDFSIKVFEDVSTYSGWNLQAKKTLYVNVPEGTSLQDAKKYALQIANNLQFVGKVESFTGPFRPQIILGDEAVIIGEKGLVSLGLITEITHRFGKNGFYTDFTVDSGGLIGKGRLSDYVGRITKDKTSSSRVYE